MVVYTDLCLHAKVITGEVATYLVYQWRYKRIEERKERAMLERMEKKGREEKTKKELYM